MRIHAEAARPSPADVQREWAKTISKRPAHAQLVFLGKQEAISALGAKMCRKLQKSIQRQLRRHNEEAPSWPWANEWLLRGTELPPGMVMSLVSGRYTPPYCLESEDALDAMSATEALFYQHPPSPSAEAIRRYFGLD